MPWMDEMFLKNLWSMMGDPLVQVRIIRDRVTGANVGYCFVDFSSHEMANYMLTHCNNQPMPGVQGSFRLNWATGSFVSGSSSQGGGGGGGANTGYYGNQ
jgi:hypothetical protein